MKRKTWLSIFSCFVLLAGLLSGCGEKQPQSNQTEPSSVPGSSVTLLFDTIPSDEYQRAIWYGFVPDSLADADPDGTVVTWPMFCEMLGNMVRQCDESAYPGWMELTADVPDTALKRDSGMIGLMFAAQAIGRDYMNSSRYPSQDYDGNECTFDYPFDWERPFDLEEGMNTEDYLWPSYEFSFARRVSSVTGQPLIDYVDGAAHLDYDFTLRMAGTAVTRLYESDEDAAFAYACAKLDEVKKTPEAQEIIAAAEARKQEILNSETKIVKSDTYIQGETYTGTAYYLSNSGDDHQDGRSPETAWATLDRLRSVDFQFGDAIFFERGGLWREAMLPDNVRNTEGLTISAYGQGEKPRLYGSPENGAGEEKWTLYFEGPGGEKIWQFHREMPDTAVIVMNDGETYARRNTPYWTGTEYVDMLDFSKPYVVEEQLADMEFFTRLPYEAEPYDPGHMFLAGHENGVDLLLEGPLYLRCDAGNPGEVYSSIEFSCAYALGDGMSDHITVDNLHMAYGKQLCGGYWDGVSTDYVYFQNCEWGWIGGFVNFYADIPDWYHDITGQAPQGEDEPPEPPYVFMDGGSCNTGGGAHDRVRNNYCHHCFQEASALETFSGDMDPCCDNLYEGNLMEYCVMGMLLINWNRELEESHIFSEVQFRDNMVLYSGFEEYYSYLNINDQRNRRQTNPEMAFGYHLMDSHAFATSEQLNPHDGTVSISGNTFAFSANKLIYIGGYTEEYSHIYNGNTYAQLPGMIWLVKTDYSPEYRNSPEFYLDPEEAIKSWIQDENARIVSFED